MDTYLISNYINAGCPEIMDAIGVAIHRLTNGKICDTGCNRFKNGNCPHYKTLIGPKDENGIAVQIETVRNEANRRGVSIKQIRKERRESHI